MTKRQIDFPISECAAACDQIIKRGGFIVQKWTCAGCGRRISANNVNVFVHNGHCQHCNHVTDLDEQGCNFMLVQPSCPMTPEEVERALGLTETGIQ